MVHLVDLCLLVHMGRIHCSRLAGPEAEPPDQSLQLVLEKGEAEAGIKQVFRLLFQEVKAQSMQLQRLFLQ